jgi:glycosyltransferase involved in cell wall biosynthesis
LNVGGPARQVLWLSRGLQDHGYDTTVVAGRIPANEASLEGEFERAGIPVLRFPEMEREISPARDVVAAWRLRRLIEEARPDLIHAHLSKAAFLVRLARVLSPGRDFAPVVYTHHGNRFRGYFSPGKGMLVRATERFLARWTEIFVVLSPQQRDEIALEFGVGRPSQYRVVPLGLDLSFVDRLESHRGALRRELGLPPVRPLVGIVGRVAPIKNHELFVDAAAATAAAWGNGDRPFFVVVGSGSREEMRSLEERVGAAGLAPDFRFLGTRSDPAEFLPDLDVVALTSRNEGTPLSLIEAMAAGLAIVATDVGGVRDLLTREWLEDAGRPWVASETPRGVLVPSGSVEDFAAALTALLREPARRERMAIASREFARVRFSLERLNRDLDKVYREVLEGPRRRV